MFTVIEAAERLEIERNNAYGFIKGLLAIGAAVPVGVRPGAPGKKGKGQNLYTLTEQADSIVKGAVTKLRHSTIPAAETKETDGFPPGSDIRKIYRAW